MHSLSFPIHQITNKFGLRFYERIKAVLPQCPKVSVMLAANITKAGYLSGTKVPSCFLFMFSISNQRLETLLSAPIPFSGKKHVFHIFLEDP